MRFQWYSTPASTFGDIFAAQHTANVTPGTFTIVNRIPASAFGAVPASGTRTARLLVAGGFVDAYIGMSGTNASFSGTPTQVKVNGASGSSNANVQMNLTDAATFTYDGVSDISVAFDLSVSSDVSFLASPPGGVSAWIKSAVNEASTITKSGYSNVSNIYLLWAIEIDGTTSHQGQPVRRVVCAGNSLTLGNGSNCGSYPSQLAFNSRWDAANVFNTGIAGDTSAQLQAANPTGSLFQSGAVAVMWEVTNSLYFGATAAQAIADYWSWVDAVKAQGYKVVVVTVLPRTNSGTPGTFEADRQTCNTALRADWHLHADALADVGNDATIGQAGQTTNATYYADLVHLTDAGYAIMYPYVKTALAGL